MLGDVTHSAGLSGCSGSSCAQENSPTGCVDQNQERQARTGASESKRTGVELAAALGEWGQIIFTRRRIARHGEQTEKDKAIDHGPT